MKKIFFAILVIAIPFSTVAQKKNITEAVFLYEESNKIKKPESEAPETELKAYQSSLIENITDSKNYIDLAASAESTSNHPKMWV